jgi:hypothetical protein
MIDVHTADIITRSDVQDWPKAIDPMTKETFTPAFIYRNHAGQQWVVSTITDGNGKHEGDEGFNPAAWPQWVALASVQDRSEWTMGEILVGNTKADATTPAQSRTVE